MPNHLRCLPPFAVFVCGAAVLAQPAPMTLSQAVEQAVGKYPAVQASQEQALAAARGVDLARTSYLPRADLLAQVNRATRNNVFGLLMPQSVISSISGPVLGTNSLTSVWGSAAGLLVSWEPFDFGLRKANVSSAEAAERRAEQAVGVTRLDVGVAAADAYLTILAADEAVRAARAGVERTRVFQQVVDALAKAELRPGAEAARAKAELAVAGTRLIQAEETALVARASLGQLLGVAPSQIAVASGPFPDAPGDLTAAAPPDAHPAAKEQSAAIEEVKAREKALSRAWYPRFQLQATSYARGGGAKTDGSTEGGANGLAPNYQNWAVGMTVNFPIFDSASIRARQQSEVHKERAEAARYRQVLQDLNGRREKANAALAGARRVVESTPVQLEAARAVEQQATARYKAGLGNIVEVADAQRLLTQAEIDDSLAKLNVWRALLAVATAQGDLEPFLKASGK